MLTWKISDMQKIYFDDDSFNEGHGHAYEKYGVDPNLGCIAVVRPDQCKCEPTSSASCAISADMKI